jgi:hypothetical protein
MSQADKLYNLLKDGREHRTDEILRVVYGSEHMGIARIGARIADLKDGKHTNGVMCDIPDARRDRENPKLFWYHINPPRPIVLPPAFPPEDQQTQPQLFA